MHFKCHENRGPLIPWCHQIFKMIVSLNNSKLHLESCIMGFACLIESLSAADSVLLMCESIMQHVLGYFLNVSGQSVLTSEQHSVVLNDQSLSMFMSLLCCFRWHSIPGDYITGMWLWYRYISLSRFTSAIFSDSSGLL